MKLIYALVLLPFAAFANPLETDFDKVFADNADQLIEKNGGKSLQMESKVLISQNGDGKYLALDGSPHEAVGCVLRITLQTTAVAKLCPESVTPEQAAMLDANVMSFAAFYSENNVPERPLGEVQGAMDEAIAALSKRLENLECKADEITKFQEFVAILTGDDTQDRLSASLADARLPVTEPCL